jgi:CheY-like chemotaxis protein
LADFKSVLLKDYPGNAALINECDRILKLYNKKEIDSIKNITTLTDSSLAITIPTEEEDATTSENKYDWEALMIDDNPNEINAIKEELNKRGILVHSAYSVKDAEEIIEKDIDADIEDKNGEKFIKKGNKITVVISDYRLFQEQKGKTPPKMQPKQGYDFLLWLSTKPRINGMIALSGLSTQFLMESFRKYSIDVKVYSKTNIRTSVGLKMLIDEIIYLGDFYYDLICSKPSSKASWDLMKPYYVKYRNTKGNYNIEQSITFKANEIIESIKEQVTFVHSLSTSNENQNSLYADLQIDIIKGIAQSNFDNIGYSEITEENLDKFYKYSFAKRGSRFQR